MRALKTIVIFLGAVLVAGFGLLIFGLTQNWHKLSPVQSAAPETAKAMPAGWGRASLGLSAEARVRSVTAAGNFIVLHVESGGERLIVLDPATGSVVGTFSVTGP